ncbi:MAG: nucleotidyltransferase domain-containing protein [Bacteroidetes bacterium]|nr:MAG: nucleotidyltransferase domain-containing protein [Bacteroidota bacterium]
MINAIIKNNLEKISSLCKHHKVKELYAFGSVTREDFKENSDVDFLVDFDNMPVLEYADNYFDLADELENILHRKIDLVTQKSLRNPVFIRVINRTRIPVYTA